MRLDKSKLYISIDLGTSAMRLLLMDASGKIHNTVTKEYPTCFLKYILCKHMAAVRRTLLVLLGQKQQPVLFRPAQGSLALFPFVAA